MGLTPGRSRELPSSLAARRGGAYLGGTEAYVAAATLADGTPAVLKLAVPREGEHARREITVLRLADGQGCARLLRADETWGALLIERLGPSMYDLGLPVRQRQQILCDAATRIWRAEYPAPGRSTHDLPTGDEMGRCEYCRQAQIRSGRQ